MYPAQRVRAEDIVCRTDTKTLIDLHLRRLRYQAAIKAGAVAVLGPPRLTRHFQDWRSSKASAAPFLGAAADATGVLPGDGGLEVTPQVSLSASIELPRVVLSAPAAASVRATPRRVLRMPLVVDVDSAEQGLTPWGRACGHVLLLVKATLQADDE